MMGAGAGRERVRWVRVEDVYDRLGFRFRLG